MLTKRCRPRKAWLALVCRKELTHPVITGLTLATNACGLIGARRDVRYCSVFRICCWAEFAGTRSMVFVPLVGRWRLTHSQPRQSKPSVTRVSRVLTLLGNSSLTEHRLRGKFGIDVVGESDGQC